MFNHIVLLNHKMKSQISKVKNVYGIKTSYTRGTL